MNYLWIVWDIVSILSILILHHINFKEKHGEIVDPPSHSNSTYIDVNTENMRKSSRNTTNNSQVWNPVPTNESPYIAMGSTTTEV